MRVAVVDIGTNSTRLLIGDVEPGGVHVEVLDRRSTVTRLGVGLEASGRLSDEAMARVLATLEGYGEAIDALGAQRRVAVLTSAARDAANGAEFTERVRTDHGLDARIVSGDEEARLSYLGATAGRAGRDDGELVVLDIGGGSTEFIVGVGGDVRFHTSTQAGVVRMSERHLHHDPPPPAELAALTADARETFGAAVPADLRETEATMVAVAGTATSMAAIDQDLEPYDPERVHGYLLGRSSAEAILARLAAMTEVQRRGVPGLHPDRAPTIVAGAAFLVEAMRLFGLERVEVSEHDILHGVALAVAAGTFGAP